MKKILLTILLGIAAVAFLVHVSDAQVPFYQPVTLGITNNVAAAFTNNEVAQIDCSKQNTVGVMLSCKASGSTSGTTTWTYYKSADGSTFETTGTAITQTENGTTTVNTFTNLNTYGCKAIKFSIANTNAALYLTNVTIVYGLKISAPSPSP